MGKIQSLDSTGHTEIAWTPGDEESEREARLEFERFKKRGCAIFKLKKGGERGKQVDEFDPRERHYLVVPPFVGG